MLPLAPRRILAATDFSDVSTYALRHAVMWAGRYGAELVILHAQECPPITGDPFFGSSGFSELLDAARQAAVQHLEEYVREHVPPKIPVTREVLDGSPAAVIAEYAAGGHVDLAVLGTHGRGGLSRVLLGSVAERMLRLAELPTLIVPHPESGSGRRPIEADNGGMPAPEPEAPRLRHILCPVNDSGAARAAFEQARAIAQAFAARLTVVFVVEPEQEARASECLHRLEETLQAWLPAEVGAPAAGSGAGGWLRRDGYQIQPVVRHGNAAEQVITLAREETVDLVVLGAQHRRFVDTTVLGVTTIRVTRHAPCPVLVVPASSAAQREIEVAGRVTCTKVPVAERDERDRFNRQLP